MNRPLAFLTCSITYFFITGPFAQAGVITALSDIQGISAGLPLLPSSVVTVFVDNDEGPAHEVNFAQLTTALPITDINQPVEFILQEADSGTGGTTEYILNLWTVNGTGTPWTSMRYSLFARDMADQALVVPGLDFDWPDKTAPGTGATNFFNPIHMPHAIVWETGVAPAGANEITTVAVDVPDIGQDYQVVLLLNVPEPASALLWSLGLVWLRRRGRRVTC